MACAERLIPCNPRAGRQGPVHRDRDAPTSTGRRRRCCAARSMPPGRSAIRSSGSTSTKACTTPSSPSWSRRRRRCGSTPTIRAPGTSARSPSRPQAEIVARHLADAVAKGATILTGGEDREHRRRALPAPDRADRRRPHDMLIMQDETFGPCIPVMAYRDSRRGDARWPTTPQFGLTASVIAGSDEEAEAIGRRINAGGIFLQDTFLTFAKMRTFGSDSFGWSGYGRPAHRAGMILRVPPPQVPADADRAGGRHPGRSSPGPQPHGSRMKITAAVSRGTTGPRRASRSSSSKSRAPARCASAWSRPASATPTCTSIPGRHAPQPIVLGHEGAGVVEALGDGRARLRSSAIT